MKIGNMLQRFSCISFLFKPSCLGKDFNISMNCGHVKEQLTKDITNYLKKIDILSLHPLQKIEICQLCVFSKLKWRFTIYHLNET